MKEYSFEAIGHRIAAERKKRHLSQADFIEQLSYHGVSIGRNRLSAIENYTKDSNHNLPDLSIRELIAFCDILQCDASYLLGEHTEKTMDKHFICQQIGLTEKAVDNLIPHSQDWQVGVLSLMIEDYLDFLPVLAGIYNYYNSYALLKEQKKTYTGETYRICAEENGVDINDWGKIFKIESTRSVTKDGIERNEQIAKAYRLDIYEKLMALIDKIVEKQYAANSKSKKRGRKKHG